jgi:hypothetical protein
MKNLASLSLAGLTLGAAFVAMAAGPASASEPTSSVAPSSASANAVLLADGPCVKRQPFPPMTVAAINTCSHDIRFKKIFIGGSQGACSRVLHPYASTFDAISINPFESGAIQELRDC